MLNISKENNSIRVEATDYSFYPFNGVVGNICLKSLAVDISKYIEFTFIISDARSPYTLTITLLLAPTPIKAVSFPLPTVNGGHCSCRTSIL